MDVAGAAYSDAGRTVADIFRGGHLAQAATDCAAGIQEIERVREIENFDSELGGYTLAYLSVFEHREIDLARRRAVELIASLVRVRSSDRESEGSLVEPIDVIGLFTRRHILVGIAGNFRAVLILLCPASICARIDRERRARIERKQRVQLPAAEQ